MEPNYRGHRFPAEIISHAVWLYHRFTLSFRDVEDLLAERGIIVFLRGHPLLVSEVRARLRPLDPKEARPSGRHLVRR